MNKELQSKNKKIIKKESNIQTINLILTFITTICVIAGIFYTIKTLDVSTKSNEFFSLFDSFEKFNNSLTLKVENTHQRGTSDYNTIILNGEEVLEEIYIFQQANENALRKTTTLKPTKNSIFNTSIGDVVSDDNMNFEVVPRSEKEINKIKEIINRMRLIAIPLINSLEKMPNKESYQRLVVSKMSRLYLEIILSAANRTGDMPNDEPIFSLIKQIEYVGLPFQEN